MTLDLLKSFTSLFGTDSYEVDESFTEVTIRIRCETVRGVDPESLGAVPKQLSARDKILISVFFGENDPIEYNLSSDPETFSHEIHRLDDIRDDEEITVTIQITKCIDAGVISIYSIDHFSSYLEGLTIEGLFLEFDTLLRNENYLVFEFQTKSEECRSNSIWFVNRGFSGTPISLERDHPLSSAKTSCHFNFLPARKLLPEDFRVTSSGCEKIATIFIRLTVVMSVAFLFDITVLDRSNLRFRINGYKSINGDVNISSLSRDLEDQYFKIYEWVYTSGNFNDKIGLARNIISLHLEDKDSIILKGDPFQSIQSSYKVYEKQNIRQYIEIRNKVSDQLLSFHDRANRIVETFASGFQRSALALITFYTSAIVLRLLNDNQLVGVFTIDAAILSSAFILCSACYFGILSWEVRAQRKRFEENYTNIKLRYNDLLDTQDISRILNNDQEFESDLTFMDTKAKYYKLLWFCFLAILLSATWVLYLIYNPVTVDISLLLKRELLLFTFL